MKSLRVIIRLYRIKHKLVSLIALIVGIILVVGIVGEVVILSYTPDPVARSWSEIRRSDTLRAVTVGSSIGAFLYKGNWMGQEYEMGEQVAKALDLNFDLEVVASEQAMLDSLYVGAADVALWPVARDVASRRGELRPVGYRYDIGQKLIGSVPVNLQWEDSVAYTLCVLEDSRQAAILESDSFRTYLPLEHLRVVTIQSDSLTPEDLVGWVADGKYDLTMVDENQANLFKTYYTQLHISPLIGGSRDSASWVVAAMADTLAQKIDSVCSLARATPQYPAIVKRYYEHSKGNNVSIRYLIGHGALSVYDPLYKRYATQLGWDWRLLAAISFVESRFDPHATSSRGARGLMQLMPSTAEQFGCPAQMLSDPETNIAAGARLLGYLQNTLRDKLVRMQDSTLAGYAAADTVLRSVVDRDLLLFTLGSFHAGLGHIYDAILLADTLGYKTSVWSANVEHCLMLKNDSAYYNLPCVRLGNFSGGITADYIDEVLETYENFKTLVK